MYGVNKIVLDIIFGHTRWQQRNNFRIVNLNYKSI